MTLNERVLVVERGALERAGMFQGLNFDVDRYLRELFAPGVPRFMLRAKAEVDPTCKQLIPYVIITHGGEYLSYVRGKQAGEARLVGLRSIGIGGHVNPADDLPLLDAGLLDTYLAAVQREVAEEVCVRSDREERIAALINDDSTEVGRVHLGIVHCWTLAAPEVSKREQMITRMAFMTIEELRGVRDSLETWSQLCLDRLDEITVPQGRRHCRSAPR